MTSFTRRFIAGLIASGFSLVAFPAIAHDFHAGPLVVRHPWLRATPPGAKIAGGYLAIENTGSEPDRLLAAAADGIAPKVELHRMSMDKGVMRMRPVEGGLEIPPGETVALEPGSWHLMMRGLIQPLKPGESFTGTLTFEKAGIVDIEFKVEAMGAGAATPMDHGAM